MASRNRENPTVPVLSASEIGQFVFCRRAWHLGRRGTAMNASHQRHLHDGTSAHRHIGRRTDRLLLVGHVRVLLLVSMAVLVAILVADAPWIAPFAHP